MTKLILTILGFFCFIHASVDRHLLNIDELKGKFAQKDYLSKSTTTEGTKNDATNTVTVTRAPNSEIVTLEEVSSLLLNIFNVINHAFHYGHLNFTAEDRKKWDISIKKLITRGNFFCDQLDNGNQMAQLTAQERAIINTFFRTTAGQKRQFTYIENLANLKRQPVQQMRLAFINIILQLYKDQVTQIEKSLEYHCNAVAIPRNADGTYRWNDGPFKRWLNEQFTAAPLAGRPRNYTEDQSVNFFQDLLINEKLHPGYYVFYHGAPYQSIGFQFFNSILVKLLNPTGQAFNPRIHIKRDIGKDTNGLYRDVAHENCTIESVTDVVNYMDATRNDDTREPVAKHLVSSSYSLFNLASPSALEYYTRNQVMNAQGIMNAFGTTFVALTTDATLLREYPTSSFGQLYRTVYPKLLTDKFTARNIDGHWGKQQPYYAPFSTMVQFFIKKERVDTTVYFGGVSGMRHRNASGNSQIREVLNAFLGPQLLGYYQRLYGNNSVRGIENGTSLQGKIAVTSEAFLNGIAANEIQLVFHGQSNKEAVILDDLKFCIQEQLREDFLKILDAPTAFTMATPAYQFKTRLGDLFNANYTPKVHNMQDIPPLKTAADIIRENPNITMAQLVEELIAMIKDQPLSVAVKEKLFIEEFFTTGILQLKPRKMTPKLIEDRLKEIFDDPLGKLTTKKLDRLRILEFVISFAEANADEKETFVELLKQVVDVLSNNNTDIPVISRVATDAEKKQEFSMLKAIAHGMLLSNDDTFIHYVINAFNVGPTDKFYKHKMWCLSALDIFMEQYINELNEVCAKLDDDLRALPAPNQHEYVRVQALETEIAEKEHRIKTPQAGDDRTQLQTQVTRLQKELHHPDLQQELTRVRLEKQMRQCDTLLNSWRQIRLEMPGNLNTKPENREAKKKVLEQKMKLRDPGAFRNYAHFVNNELLQ